jgi:hypothetical protein
MISELANILPNFSEVGHTRCFLHIVNLVAKSIIRQFDLQKRQGDKYLDKAEQELRDLAGVDDLEDEQANHIMEHEIDGEIDVGDEANDNNDGWIDETMLLSPSERQRSEEDIRPVKLVLVKVSLSVALTSREWYTYMLAASKTFI